MLEIQNVSKKYQDGDKRMFDAVSGVSLTLSLFEMLLHAVRHAHAKKQR